MDNKKMYITVESNLIKNKNELIRKLIILISPIVIGGLIYLTYRVETLKIFGYSDNIGTTFLIEFLRNNNTIQSLNIPDWIKFNLPDALWAYSFTYSILLLWNFKINRANALWIFIVPMTILFAEIGQFFGIVSGTFDILDLFFVILAMIIPFMYSNIFNLKSIKNEKIKQQN